VLLDDEDSHNIVDENNNAHSNAPNDSYKQSTITVLLRCSEFTAGGARAARSFALLALLACCSLLAGRRCCCCSQAMLQHDCVDVY
jgi:hypothetical protein